MVHKHYPTPTDHLPEPEVPQVETPEDQTSVEPYLDPTSTIEGFPGHRTAAQHSGLDPLESGFEFAHVMGAWLKALFTGRVRSRNPLALLMMLFFGIVGVLALTVGIIESLNGNPMIFFAWFYLLPIGLIGLALVGSFLTSLSALIFRR